MLCNVLADEPVLSNSTKAIATRPTVLFCDRLFVDSSGLGSG
ncbi:hypothetical protein S7335_1352 [Synechococcus sp. PCC 7335]|nr:hypothetical protein S7335_1352 [Synechococcus sp. PCC 7335]